MDNKLAIDPKNPEQLGDLYNAETSEPSIAADWTAEEERRAKRKYVASRRDSATRRRTDSAGST